MIGDLMRWMRSHRVATMLTSSQRKLTYDHSKEAPMIATCRIIRSNGITPIQGSGPGFSTTFLCSIVKSQHIHHTMNLPIKRLLVDILMGRRHPPAYLVHSKIGCSLWLYTVSMVHLTIFFGRLLARSHNSLGRKFLIRSRHTTLFFLLLSFEPYLMPIPIFDKETRHSPKCRETCHTPPR